VTEYQMRIFTTELPRDSDAAVKKEMGDGWGTD
jgi:hypothetical protein